MVFDHFRDHKKLIHDGLFSLIFCDIGQPKEKEINKIVIITQRRAKKFEKVKEKNPVKSNKSISWKNFFNIFHDFKEKIS